MRRWLCSVVLVAVALPTVPGLALRAQEAPFRGGVDLVYVTATVTDLDGRFVSGLTRDQFVVSEDGTTQDITYFDNERVPVSLGLLLDVSGSMNAEKMASARAAVARFAEQLLVGSDDEFFLMQFANGSEVLQDWTREPGAIRRALGQVRSSGGTALYDAVAAALPLAASGHNRKKALLIITDGNDSSSRRTAAEVQSLIRSSDVLVYALGVDGGAELRPSPRQVPRAPRVPLPFPVPGRPGGFGGRIPLPFPQIGSGRWPGTPGQGVDDDVLRRLTDDTGGRTEVVKGITDLGAATARIADELSRQYVLGYVRPGVADGHWHSIRVRVSGAGLTVRSRRGYTAS